MRVIFQLCGASRERKEENFFRRLHPARGRCAAKRSLPPTLLARSSVQEDATPRQKSGRGASEPLETRRRHGSSFQPPHHHHSPNGGTTTVFVPPPRRTFPKCVSSLFGSMPSHSATGSPNSSRICSPSLPITLAPRRHKWRLAPQTNRARQRSHQFDTSESPAPIRWRLIFSSGTELSTGFLNLPLGMAELVPMLEFGMAELFKYTLQ